eukprot:NODE_4953_length_1826_cov_24.572690.p1 GENE.NODE_4953_length_1826_cov_24.572690~~NODE_4953_length_1826_cov_24.572690.p1  ORF type:complete len:480 (+),score=136.66 NODE_4953_length_1826_cov_24.572690:148-1587(+)
MRKSAGRARRQKAAAVDVADGPAPVASSGGKNGELAPNLEGEYLNILTLMVLYTLQGIPIGLSACMPLILQNRGASYEEIGAFTFSKWPFSLKLLWAPIVDALYVKAFGRRKCWMVPTQLLIGAVLWLMSYRVDDWLKEGALDLRALTGAFFLLFFLTATQDIAVDGWAVSMLRPENVAYGATCNAAGQTLGYFLAFTGFMALEHFGFVTLSGFAAFWSVAFVVSTIAFALLKHEAECSKEDEPPSVKEAYWQLLCMLGCRPILIWTAVQLVWNAPFAPAVQIAGLKLVEYGIPKEHMAYFAALMTPITIVIPLLVAKDTGGPAPLRVCVKVYGYRTALTLIAAIVVWQTPTSIDPMPWVFYTVMFCLLIVQTVCSSMMFVALMAFHSRITKAMPNIAGTYMTMLNTIYNLGNEWCSTATFFALGKLSCTEDHCSPKRDGYYLLSAIATAFGFVLLLIIRPVIEKLQAHKLADWKVKLA